MCLLNIVQGSIEISRFSYGQIPGVDVNKHNDGSPIQEAYTIVSLLDQIMSVVINLHYFQIRKLNMTSQANLLVLSNFFLKVKLDI